MNKNKSQKPKYFPDIEKQNTFLNHKSHLNKKVAFHRKIGKKS